MMNHLAFRRDTADEQLVVQFAVQVGSPEAAANAVHPHRGRLGGRGAGRMGRLEAEVVTDLYHRTMQHLAGRKAGNHH